MGVQANTVVLLARALQVSASWLLTGQEPSGLSAQPATPVDTSGELEHAPPRAASSR